MMRPGPPSSRDAVRLAGGRFATESRVLFLPPAARDLDLDIALHARAAAARARVADAPAKHEKRHRHENDYRHDCHDRRRATTAAAVALCLCHVETLGLHQSRCNDGTLPGPPGFPA